MSRIFLYLEFWCCNVSAEKDNELRSFPCTKISIVDVGFIVYATRSFSYFKTGKIESLTKIPINIY